MILEASHQVLKTRDDHAPVLVERDSAPSEPNKPFRLSADTKCSWLKIEEFFGPEKLRPRIEPWLTALVQSEHLSVLVGSGLTHAIHRMAAEKPAPGMDAVAFDFMSEEIATDAKRTAEAAGRQRVNFEDQIRVASELLRGLEILACTKAADSAEHRQVSELRAEITKALTSFASSILLQGRASV